MEKHRVPVKEELVVLNIIVITERLTLHRIIAQSKDSNSGFWVSESQMLGDVKDLSTNIKVDNVGSPWVWCIIVLIFFLNRGVEVVH